MSNPSEPSPASVVTSPEAETRRTRFAVSTVYMTSLPSIAMPRGPWNLASVPCPSKVTDGPPQSPAKESTAPAVVMERKQLLSMSVAYSTPAELTTSPKTLVKFAFVPSPLAKPHALPPASVVTSPVASIARTAQL